MKRSFIYYLLLIVLLGTTKESRSQNCVLSSSCQLAATLATSSYPCAAGGNVTVNVTSGTAPYTYVWSPNVSSTNQASNLAAGTYSVTVFDSEQVTPMGPELVVNGDFSAGNTGFTSTYTYCNTGLCLYPPQYYSVGANPQFYHNQFWGSDHTTGTGNFMIINADDMLNMTVWEETITVTPNSDYVFSAWMSSMNTFPPATMQFLINGVLVGNPFTAPAQINHWDQFCTVWNSGSSTVATIAIVNKSLINLGNDCGLDDISFRGMTRCSTTLSVNIPQQAGVLSSVTATNISCNGMNNGTATVNVNGGTPPFNYAWNTTPVQTSPTANNLGAGTYSVSITDANGCTSTQTVSITQPPSMSTMASATPASCGMNSGTATASASGGNIPYTYIWLTSPVQTQPSISNLGQGTYNVLIADANGCTQQQTVVVGVTGNFPTAVFTMSDDSLELNNPFVQFTDLSSNAYSWSWNFGDGTTSTLQNPSHTYSDTGTFCVTLVVRDANGFCLDSTVQCLEIYAEFSFYISNAFTPNGDWANETFFGKGRGIKDYDIWLFDRWGNLIWDCSYEGKSADWDIAGKDGMPSACKWDGKVVAGGVDMSGASRELVQEDVYVWKVRLTDIFNKEHKYIGHVSVVK